MRKYLSFLEGMGLELKQLDEVTTKKTSSSLISVFEIKFWIVVHRNRYLLLRTNILLHRLVTAVRLYLPKARYQKCEPVPEKSRIFLGVTSSSRHRWNRKLSSCMARVFRCGHTNANAGSSPTGSHIRLLATGLSEIVGRAGCTDTFPSCIA